MTLFPAMAAPDVPYAWGRESVAVAAFPSGLINDTRAQVRIPLHRSASVLFQDTFAGAGVRFAVTPVFVAVGPRLTIAPVDVFDLDLQASWLGYYGRGGMGLLPYSTTSGKLESERRERRDESVTGSAVQLSASPTLKAKVGRFVAFYNVIGAWTVITPRDAPDEPYVYEPFSDLVVAWEDVTLEQQGAALVDVVRDRNASFFSIGPTLRDRRAFVSGDASTAAGVLVRARLGRGAAVPTLVQQTLFYVRDADRVGAAPNVALLATWQIERPLAR